MTTMPRSRRRLDIDVVDPDPGAADNLEPFGAGEKAAGDLGSRAHGEPVIAADAGLQLVGGKARARKSTSIPRAVRISAARGLKASEINTFGIQLRDFQMHDGIRTEGKVPSHVLRDSV